MAKKERKPRERKQMPVIEVDGEIVDGLKQKDFPMTLEGRQLHARYQLLKWGRELANLKALESPEGRRAAKIARMESNLKKLRAEAKADADS